MPDIIAKMAILYVIASPIGNLEDMTPRAVRILREEVDIVFCEDTRVTSKLTNHFDIQVERLISCNKENENKRVKEALAYLEEGKNIAIISDAGTPLISDPGSEIVRAVYESAEYQLVSLPGASALTAALAICPFDTSRFIFEGFLPHGGKQRRRVLRQLIAEERAIVFYESPHRIMKTLSDIDLVFNPEEEEMLAEASCSRKSLESSVKQPRKVFLARELTKKFEENYLGTIEEVLEALRSQFPDKVQGEMVLVLEGLLS